MKPPPGQCWQFRDQTIPVNLILLIKGIEVDGKKIKLNAKDLLLIFVIGALVRPQDSKDGIGCYASNEYLGDAIGDHPINVSKRISKLKSLDYKILVEVQYENRRYLELEWSRTLHELQHVAGQYGKLLRESHRAIGKEVKELTLSENANPTLSNSANPTLSENANHNSYGISINESNDKTHPPQASGSVRSSILVSGKSIEESSPAQKWTRKLWMKIDTIGKLNTRHQNESDLSKWVKKIEKILTKGPKNGPIPSQTEFDYYMGKLIPLIKPDMGEKYIPVIYSAAALYEKWDRVVAAIDRKEGKPFNQIQKEITGPRGKQTTDENGVVHTTYTVEVPFDDNVIN